MFSYFTVENNFQIAKNIGIDYSDDRRLLLSPNWPIDSPPFCPGLHDLRIDCLNTYYKMKAISLHYNITDQLSD